MKDVRWWPCVFVLACAADPLQPFGPPEVDRPTEPPLTEDSDTGGPPPERADCELATDIAVRDLSLSHMYHPHGMVSDLDSDGRSVVLRYAPGATTAGIDTIGPEGVVRELLSVDDSAHLMEPRVTADGRIAYGYMNPMGEEGFGWADPATGEEVAFVPFDIFGVPTIEPGPDGFLYVTRRGHEWAIAGLRADGELRLVDSAGQHPDGIVGVLDLALSSDGDAMWASVVQANSGQIRIVEYARGQDGAWGAPLTRWFSPDLVEFWGAPIEADACDNVYIAGATGLWVLRAGSSTPERVVALPELQIYFLYWGTGGGGTKADALYGSGGYVAGPHAGLVKQVEIDLDVTGTHVLAP